MHHEQKWEQEGNGLKYTVPRPRWLLPRLTPFWHIDYDHTQISIMEGKGGWQKPMPCLSRGLDKRMSNVVCRRRKALGMWHCIQQVVFLTLSSAVVGVSKLYGHPCLSYSHVLVLTRWQRAYAIWSGTHPSCALDLGKAGKPLKHFDTLYYT